MKQIMEVGQVKSSAFFLALESMEMELQVTLILLGIFVSPIFQFIQSFSMPDKKTNNMEINFHGSFTFTFTII